MIETEYVVRCDGCHCNTFPPTNVAEYSCQSLVVAGAKMEGWELCGDKQFCPQCAKERRMGRYIKER